MSIAVINADKRLREVLDQISSKELKFTYFSQFADLNNPEEFYCLLSNEVVLPETLNDTTIMIGKDKSYDLVKPFKIKALLNLLIEHLHNRIYTLGQLSFHPFSKHLWIEKSENKISLTEKENSLLLALVKSKDRSLSKEYILKTLWNYSDDSETSTLETHIYNLKSKLSSIDSGNLLEIKDKAIFLNINSG